MSDDRLEAWQDGRKAFLAGEPVTSNPFTPAPPGNHFLARLWRQGWQAERRAHR